VGERDLRGEGDAAAEKGGGGGGGGGERKTEVEEPNFSHTRSLSASAAKENERERNRASRERGLLFFGALINGRDGAPRSHSSPAACIAGESVGADERGERQHFFFFGKASGAAVASLPSNRGLPLRQRLLVSLWNPDRPSASLRMNHDLYYLAAHSDFLQKTSSVPLRCRIKCSRRAFFRLVFFLFRQKKKHSHLLSTPLS